MKNTYAIEGETVLIKVERPNGDIKTVKVSKCDLDKLLALDCGWYIAERAHCEGYAAATVKNEKGDWSPIHMHRFLLDYPKGKVIDHINHDTLDNRRENLRLLSRAHNTMHRKGANPNNKSSKVRGVTFCKHTGKWRVRFSKWGKTICYGRYLTLEEATKVAEKAVKEVFPEVLTKENGGVIYENSNCKSEQPELLVRR